MPLHDNEIVDYEDDQLVDSTAVRADDITGDTADGVDGEGSEVAGHQQGNYVTIHSSGFRDFFLKPDLVRAINDAGFEHPSEVQHEAIPQAIMGVDIICQAKSGMGKTAVFVLSILQQLKMEKELQAGECLCLGIAHTRELAFQIKNEFERFSKYMNGVRVMVVYGGVSIKEQISTLSMVETTPHIVIGTPGRVNQLIREGHLKCEQIDHFVVDECDKVLDKLDMRKDVQQIFLRTPKQKQVMMFSATFSKEIQEVCKRFMVKPIEIFVDDESKLTLHGLLQYYVKLADSGKNRKLADLLDELEFNQVIVFVKSVSRAKTLNQILNENSFPSIAIHAGLSQQERIQQYQAFKNFESRILISTDLFGRGIDIERVNIVINYDMPDVADSYLHRVGRAGRFGTKGLAISFVDTEEDQAVLNGVQSRFEVQICELPAEIRSSDYINQ
eukprot:GHVH01010737.1.p1 GENE.GHVH01010737.1~~GHVH01010737.1.p1  ORF type:complete len:444 (+),score=80.37 GHVH01010737.1:74-1405(+)